MTACPRAEDLYLYLEAELGERETRALEAHLELCPACRERLADRRLLHEAFTSLPPFEVPPDFARSVMAGLPGAEGAGAGWLGPLVAAMTALAVGLLGFHLFTGASLSDMLVAVNRFFGLVIARSLPLAAKAFKIGNLLLKVASDLASMGVAGLGAFSRSLGPRGVGLILGLVALLSMLVVFGARRLFSLGEKT